MRSEGLGSSSGAAPARAHDNEFGEMGPWVTGSRRREYAPSSGAGVDGAAAGDPLTSRSICPSVCHAFERLEIKEWGTAFVRQVRALERPVAGGKMHHDEMD